MFLINIQGYSMDLEDFRDYLLYERHLVDTTIHNYITFIKELHKFCNKSPSEIVRDDFRAFIQYLEKDRQLSGATVSNYMNAYRTFYNWLADKTQDKNILSISFFLSKIVKVKRNSKVTIVPTPEDVERLRKALWSHKEAWSFSKSNQMYNLVLRDIALIELLISTGARSAELRNLTYSDIDLENTTILIRVGKGGKQRMALFNDRAGMALSQYFENVVFNPDDLIFPIKQGNMVNYIIHRWAVRAGINQKIHAHSFRHYHITHAQMMGVPDQVVADQVGHNSLNTTRGYTHFNLQYRRENYKKTSL